MDMLSPFLISTLFSKFAYYHLSILYPHEVYKRLLLIFYLSLHKGEHSAALLFLLSFTVIVCAPLPSLNPLERLLIIFHISEAQGNCTSLILNFLSVFSLLLSYCAFFVRKSSPIFYFFYLIIFFISLNILLLELMSENITTIQWRGIYFTKQ